jgi:uncharacterized protein YxjI
VILADASPSDPRYERPVNQALVPGGPTALTADPFSHPRYVIKRPFWSFFGRTFKVFSPDGHLIMFIKHPLLKLREEFTVWADEGQSQPLLHIKSRQVIAINFSYDIADARTNQWLGTVQKQGLKSILRDTFQLLDTQGQVVGKAEEKGASILRRFFPWLTSKHAIELGNVTVTEIRQKFRFFIKEFHVDLSMGAGYIDPRFAIAVALLALMAESRREQSQ